MKTGCQNVAQRIINAQEHFVALLAEIASIHHVDARKVFGAYRKAKVIKLDAVGGRYNVKHGAFLECEVIRNTLRNIQA
jgi:hypothetical protein